jgi:hypothetical protein
MIGKKSFERIIEKKLTKSNSLLKEDRVDLVDVGI